jgi:hypothetical protein
MLFELGMMYSVLFNLAAIKDNPKAARLRCEIADQMSEAKIAAAQRAARDRLVGNHAARYPPSRREHLYYTFRLRS